MNGTAHSRRRLVARRAWPLFFSPAFESDRPGRDSPPSGRDGGHLLDLVRTAARGLPFAWSFPAAGGGHSGGCWRLWSGSDELFDRIREESWFQTWLDRGLMQGQPHGFCAPDTAAGVTWIRDQSRGTNPLGSSRQRRLLKRWEDRHQDPRWRGPTERPQVTATPHRAALTQSQMMFWCESHQRGPENEIRRLPLVVHPERNTINSNGAWGGWVDSFGFASVDHAVVLPDERYTVGLLWR